MLNVVKKIIILLSALWSLNAHGQGQRYVGGPEHTGRSDPNLVHLQSRDVCPPNNFSVHCADAHLSKIKRMMRARRYHRAYNNLRHFLNYFPKDREALGLAARIQLQHKNPRKALSYYRAVKMRYLSPVDQFFYCYALYYSNFDSKAKRCFAKIEKANIFYAESQFFLGVEAYKKADYKTAEEYFSETDGLLAVYDSVRSLAMTGIEQENPQPLLSPKPKYVKYRRLGRKKKVRSKELREEASGFQFTPQIAGDIYDVYRTHATRKTDDRLYGEYRGGFTLDYYNNFHIKTPLRPSFNLKLSAFGISHSDDRIRKDPLNPDANLKEATSYGQAQFIFNPSQSIILGKRFMLEGSYELVYAQPDAKKMTRNSITHTPSFALSYNSKIWSPKFRVLYQTEDDLEKKKNFGSTTEAGLHNDLITDSFTASLSLGHRIETVTRAEGKPASYNENYVATSAGFINPIVVPKVKASYRKRGGFNNNGETVFATRHLRHPNKPQYIFALEENDLFGELEKTIDPIFLTLFAGGGLMQYRTLLYSMDALDNSTHATYNSAYWGINFSPITGVSLGAKAVQRSLASFDKKSESDENFVTHFFETDRTAIFTVNLAHTF